MKVKKSLLKFVKPYIRIYKFLYVKNIRHIIKRYEKFRIYKIYGYIINLIVNYNYKIVLYHHVYNKNLNEKREVNYRTCRGIHSCIDI